MAKKIKIVSGVMAKVILPTFQQMRERAEAEAEEAEKQQGLLDSVQAGTVK